VPEEVPGVTTLWKKYLGGSKRPPLPLQFLPKYQQLPQTLASTPCRGVGVSFREGAAQTSASGPGVPGPGTGGRSSTDSHWRAGAARLWWMLNQCIIWASPVPRLARSARGAGDYLGSEKFKVQSQEQGLAW